tara:strand:+ start:2854 stop:3768 length:915 start_codon:yes stop_codon:yes gene_type:complete
MQLTPHDEFLHKGYPKTDTTSWKENYYFNFVDENADAMGIFHASIQRHNKLIAVKVLIVIDSELFSYKNNIAWPTEAIDHLDDSVVVGDDKLCFRIVEPFLKHQVLFSDGGTSITLNYKERFPEYLYPEKENTDQSLSVVHYEQGMHVSGEINYKGRTRSIECFGHRDHTWGFRDESGLVGWHWIAIQSERSTWNFALVSRNDGTSSKSGFISNGDMAQSITDVEVLSVEPNAKGEPINAHYKVTTENGDVFHVSAERHKYIPIPIDGAPGTSAFVHENISKFIVEETGEKGIGIDEHMVSSST